MPVPPCHGPHPSHPPHPPPHAIQALASVSEYKEWLRLYSLALAQQQAVLRARELCDDLLGPLEPAAASSGAAAPAWEPTVLGLSKRALLKEVVLPSLATNRALQRLLSEYLESLKDV